MRKKLCESDFERASELIALHTNAFWKKNVEISNAENEAGNTSKTVDNEETKTEENVSSAYKKELAKKSIYRPFDEFKVGPLSSSVASQSNSSKQLGNCTSTPQ